MRVAVITNTDSRTGRSTLIVTLASLFSRSQHKTVTIYATGDMKDLLNTVELKSDISALNSPSMFKAELESKTVRGRELYDYALRIGTEEVYAFNIYDNAQHDSSKQIDIYENLLSMDTSDLELIEIMGDINDALNKKILSDVDAILNVFNQDKRSIANVREYIATYDERVVRRTGYICTKYNPDVVGDRKLAKLLGISIRELMQVPYSPIILSTALDGQLNKIAKLIIDAHAEALPLRPKLLEIMQYLFDYNGHKYIKGVEQWYK